MPVFKNGRGNAPAWCEMTDFEIRTLRANETVILHRFGDKEKLFICEGSCEVERDGKKVLAGVGDILSLDSPESRFHVTASEAPARLARVGGHWGEETGGAGVFTLKQSTAPRNDGDPTPYPRNTEFDNHYHDFDEYWIIVKGQGKIVTEGKSYSVTAGDCVATGRGHHHDFPVVEETITGVYFETTLEGRKRLGHLWEHTHGPAEPVQERV